MEKILLFLFRSALSGVLTFIALCFLFGYSYHLLGIPPGPLLSLCIMVPLLIIMYLGPKYGQYAEDFDALDNALGNLQDAVTIRPAEAVTILTDILNGKGTPVWNRFFKEEAYIKKYLQQFEIISNKIIKLGDDVVSSQQRIALYKALDTRCRSIEGSRHDSQRMVFLASTLDALRMAAKSECFRLIKQLTEKVPTMTLPYYVEFIFELGFAVHKANAAKGLRDLLRSATDSERFEAMAVILDFPDDLRNEAKVALAELKNKQAV